MKSRRVMILFAIVAAVALAGLIPTLVGDKTAEAPLVAMNPNAARPGKVWSSEHGHWHDVTPGGGTATASAMPTSPALTPIAPQRQARPSTPKPQPEGPVPAGKVWSSEHGHWHDAPKN
ncbi:MAG TPA: hypothetical protein VE010_12985 [Thermoanaerobaculia bacterium]|nr:hypothetical protein [Thermoanaerobaculia bacterium]